LVCICVAHFAHAAELAYVANSLDNTVSILDIGSNALVATIPVGSGPRTLALGVDASAVYVGHDDSEVLGGGSVWVLDATRRTARRMAGVEESVMQVVTNPHVPSIFVLNGAVMFADMHLTVVDAASGAATATIAGETVLGDSSR
jgi:YVTN family beta-propeller protein